MIPKPRILIVSEGEKTEPEYFRGFAKACRNPRVTIEMAPEHGVPRTLVEVARDYKKEAKEKRRARKGRQSRLRLRLVLFSI